MFLFHNGNFYLSSNLLYDVFPVNDRNTFVVKYKRDFVLYNMGECRVINEKGAIATAEGNFADNIFQGSYQFQGEVDGPKSVNSSFMCSGIIWHNRSWLKPECL